jgi:integrase
VNTVRNGYDRTAIAKVTGLATLTEEEPDSLSDWLEAYFALEVTTSVLSQREQRRDLERFLAFMRLEAGNDHRVAWTPRLSRVFVEALRSEVQEAGGRRFSDRTINRTLAHLKTFATWIHKHRPFPFGNPTEKLKNLIVPVGLEIERALTEEECVHLLEAADLFPVIGGRSRDQRRYKNITLPNERPCRKGYRPWRNRAIIYTLIETGMRRAAVTQLNIDDVDVTRQTVVTTEKGGPRHRYAISKKGLKAIEDYLARERGRDAGAHASPALFLPAATVVNSAGRLTPKVINTVWNEACRLARIRGKTPHSARHAMGRHIMKKTGNAAAVQRQLGHSNVAYSLQYARITDEELQDLLDER